MVTLLTVIVPTYNRSELLFRTLSFLQRSSRFVRIVVADGSDDAHAKSNARCTILDKNITYFHLPTDAKEPLESYFSRIFFAMDLLTTPYVVFCGDDDILLIENALRSAQFLEENEDYVACHGDYLLFRYVGESIHIEDVAYEGASIDGVEVGTRLMQLFTHYEAPYYAVYRTSIQRKLLARCRDAEMPLWPEIYHSTAAVVEGKIQRIGNIHSLRNTGVAPHHAKQMTNFGRWVAEDLDGLLVGYRKFREVVIGWAKERADCQIGEERLRNAIDMAFVLYIGREFDPTYWIDHYLEIAIAGDSEKTKLRARLEPILFGGKTNVSDADDKLAILPLDDAFRSLFISVIRFLIGEKGVRVIQSVKRKGIKGLIEDRHKSDSGWVQSDGGWILTKTPGGGPRPEIQVAGFLRRRHLQEQWDVLRNISLRDSV